MKKVEYFMIPSSPWTYLGHARLHDIATRHGASIEMKPFDLGKVFPLSGGLPLPKRAPQRQRYRLEELKRWRDALDVPMVLEPEFFPVAADDALRVLIAAQKTHGADRAFTLAGTIMKACWANEQNISDLATLAMLADKQGMDGKALIEQSASMQADLDRNTQEAIDAHVFGSPWFRINGESFWGQDRLDFVDKALS